MRLRLLLLTAVVVAVAPGLAAAQTTMTLKCSGEQTLSRDDMVKPMKQPWSETFLIDPVHQHYCGASCGLLGPKDLADPTKVVLRQFNAHRLSQPLVFDKASGTVTSREVKDISPTNHATLVKEGNCQLSEKTS